MRLIQSTFILLVASGLVFAEPIALHPGNPHYLTFKGKPTLLISSAEHYGALLNLDFDFTRYFRTLAQDELNHTRVFSGAYVEPMGAFNIAQNTLAPAEGKFISPWARSDTPGYPNGGNKFDMDHWNPTYFERLHRLMKSAAENDVIIEFVLFCPFYSEKQWELSPQNPANNVNNAGPMDRNLVYTMDQHGGLLRYHEALTRKVVEELNVYDNLYIEVCNEPYFGGVTQPWHDHIARLIAQTEAPLPKKHLISWNVANGQSEVKNPDSAYSIFNFHYAYPPTTVALNYDLNKVIGDNETGFRGTDNLPYRAEAWAFLMAGGGLFSHLDYSFTAGHEDGTFEYPPSQPGGGNGECRRQLKFLRSFLEQYDFTRMKPDRSIVQSGVPDGFLAHALAEPGKAAAVYVSPRVVHDKSKMLDLSKPRRAELRIEWTTPSATVTWVHPSSGKTELAKTLQVNDGVLTLESPEFHEDIALRVVAANQSE